MASQRFRTIFERNIGQFVGYFSEDATKLFRDEKYKLIHPGEYGRYREDACKNILRLVLNKRVAIDDGFVLTSDEQITTQCDIVIYNSAIAPIVADGVSRMFPAEEVRMIGEIKSTLSKSDFIKTLRKLAENKRIVMESRTGIVIEKRRENEEYNTIGTFLVCSKLDFDYDNLRYEEIYEGIDRKYWHNGILSVEDAFLSYALDFNIAPDYVKKVFVENNFNMNQLANWSYSFLKCEGETILTRQNHIHVKQENKYDHIISFFVCMANVNDSVWIYEYEPSVYLGYCVDDIFYE